MIHINLHLSAFPQAHRKRFLAQEVVIRFLEPAKERGAGPADSRHVSEILAAGYREARKGVLLEENDPVHCHLDATIKKAIAVIQERRTLFTPSVAKLFTAAFRSCRAVRTWPRRSINLGPSSVSMGTKRRRSARYRDGSHGTLASETLPRR